METLLKRARQRAVRRRQRESVRSQLPNYQVAQLPNYQATRLPNQTAANRGFTIIELMVVMTIIVVLSTMGLVQYRRSIVYSKEAVLREDLFRMNDAIDQYYADKNEYPSQIDSLVSEGYMRAIPKDPFTDSTTTWQTSPAEPDGRNPTASPGIYQIKSGSDATALDGTRYADW